MDVDILLKLQKVRVDLFFFLSFFLSFFFFFFFFLVFEYGLISRLFVFQDVRFDVPV